MLKLLHNCTHLTRFSNTWTTNFQMFKLDLEKAEEPEIKLSTSVGMSKKQETSTKISISALLTMPKPGIQSHHFTANRWGNSGNRGWLYFSGLQNHCIWWLQPWNEKTLTPWKKSCDQPRQHIKKQRHYFVKKRLSSQGYGFSGSHVWM